MPERSLAARWLFRLCFALATLLLALVLLAPLLDAGEPAPTGGRRILALFARDSALRRTSLASAAGLVVTACVFFLPASPPAPGPDGPRRPRSSGIAGA
jgi:hypothetical protein